jgi:hypothetical protein
MHSRKINQIVPAVFFFFALLACNLTGGSTSQPATEAGNGSPSSEPATAAVQPASPTEIVHLSMPGELPSGWDGEVIDRDTSLVAAERRVVGSENFALDLFERPFNADTMDTYYPAIDIVRARFYKDSPWEYATIKLSGPGVAGFDGVYGIEVDLDVNGRGDVLVLARQPGAQWSTDGVQVWTDTNHDVGGAHPLQADAPVAGDGYETLLFDAGVGADPDLAWARLSATEANVVEIAFKASLLYEDDSFTWGAWAMNPDAVQPGWFDLNDHFTHEQAGSPLIELAQFYPIKQLAGIDNTCRWSVGFTPTGSEPGICPVPATPTPILPGKITGVVFYDGVNGDLILDGASVRLMGVTVRARSGNCTSPGGLVTAGLTNTSGVYSLTVPPGTYCVDVNPDPAIGWSSKTPPQTVTVANGGTVNNVNFGYRSYLGMR